MFHASLLSPYHETTAHGPNFSWLPPDLIDGKEEYEVECVDHWRHGRAKRLQYLIKWKRYSESDNTWKPLNQVHAPKLIREYHMHFLLEDKRAKARLIAAILQTECPSPQNPRSNPSLHTSSHPPQPEELSSSTSSFNPHSPSVIGITSSVTDFPKAMPGNTCHIATTAGVHSITLTDCKRCPTTTATVPHTMFATSPPPKNGQPMPTTSPLDHNMMTPNPHALGQKTPLLKNGLLTLLTPRRKKLPSYQYPSCGEAPLTDHMLASGAHGHSQDKTTGRHTLRPIMMLEDKRCIPVPTVCAPSIGGTIVTSMPTHTTMMNPTISSVGCARKGSPASITYSGTTRHITLEPGQLPNSPLSWWHPPANPPPFVSHQSHPTLGHSLLRCLLLRGPHAHLMKGALMKLRPASSLGGRW